MIIRKAELGDLRSLTELFDLYRVFYKKKSDREAAQLFLKERMENEESIIFVSFNDEKKMTGFSQLYPIFSSTRMKRFWLLNDLFVQNDFRRQGFSIALIEKGKELCRLTGACGMMLETAKSNVEGNILYPKAGFLLDTKSNYYEWEVLKINSFNMEMKKFEVEASDYKLIAELIQSDASPVGIDAKKTHVIILKKLQEICDRLEKIERAVKVK